MTNTQNQTSNKNPQNDKTAGSQNEGKRVPEAANEQTREGGKEAGKEQKSGDARNASPQNDTGASKQAGNTPFDNRASKR